MTVRIILSAVLLFGFLAGAISLFLQKKNGLTKSMACFTLFAGLHVGMMFLLGLVDVCKPEHIEILKLERIAWNWIAVGWIISGACLIWNMLKSEE